MRVYQAAKLGELSEVDQAGDLSFVQHGWIINRHSILRKVFFLTRFSRLLFTAFHHLFDVRGALFWSKFRPAKASHVGCVSVGHVGKLAQD